MAAAQFSGRLHHCIADGIALVQVLLSLTDAQPDGPSDAPPAVPPDFEVGPAHAAEQPWPLAAHTPYAHAQCCGVHQPLCPGSREDVSVQMAVQTAIEPAGHVVETAYTAGLISVTGTAILAKLLVLPPDNDSVFKGELGIRRHVVWSELVALEDVRMIPRAANATINDILVTAVAGALRRAMEAHGGAVDIRAMVPVNLRDPSNFPLNWATNLRWSISICRCNSPAQRCACREVKRQMDMLKQSPSRC